MDGEWACELCTVINTSHTNVCQACYKQKPRKEPSFPNVSRSHPLCERPPNGTGYGWSTNVLPDDERRIVFIGRTGSGKSATGNNILNKMTFESSACGSSVTRVCQRGRGRRFNRDIQIIDSPGLFDTEMSNGDITREVVKCVGMTAPGPHAFVLVVRIDRFTKEENETVEHFKQVFGEGMLDYLIILFTRKDDLEHEGKTLKEYLKKVPQNLQDLAKACNNRCIAFNNRGSEEIRNKDVEEFLNLVDSVLVYNGGRCYTSEMYQEAETNMKKREEELKKEHEMKAQREREAIRSEYEQKLALQKTDQDDFASQLKKRINELEQEKEAESKKKDSEAGVADLSKEMESLKLAMKEIKEEKEKAEKQLQEEKERKEREVLKQLEAENLELREKVREEVNKEKPGVMKFLEDALPTIANIILPIAAKILLKI